jgi:hypothetical protein
MILVLFYLFFGCLGRYSPIITVRLREIARPDKKFYFTNFVQERNHLYERRLYIMHKIKKVEMPENFLYF